MNTKQTESTTLNLEQTLVVYFSYLDYHNQIAELHAMGASDDDIENIRNIPLSFLHHERLSELMTIKINHEYIEHLFSSVLNNNPRLINNEH